MSSSYRVGSSPSTFTPATARTATGPNIQPPSAKDLEGVKSAKELGADFKLGVTKDSKSEDVVAALSQLVGGPKAQGYSSMMDAFLGNGPFKTRALDGIQKEMSAWLKANPNATPTQVFEQASKTMMTQVLMNKTFKETIDQMASAAVNRMKDTFEG
jgi:hypothetical protein